MRAAVFALVALGIASVSQVAPAAAQPYNPGPFSFHTPSGYPICMRTRFDQDDCSYSNFAQCRAAASGLGQSCFVNPAVAYAPIDDEPPVRRKRRRHHY
jgi:hypothetical protein